MKKITTSLLTLLFMTSFVMTGVSFADEGAASVSQSDVDDLTKKVEALERQVSVLSSQPKASVPTYSIPSASESGSGKLQGITLTGFVDTQYNNNFSNHTTNPNSATGGAGNPLRSFDRNQNTFSMNNAEFDIEKLANPEGGAGFRVDLSAGVDQQLVDGLGNGQEAHFGFQQAYVQVVAPLHAFDDSEILGSTMDIKAGRFVTLAGAEVIEGRDNWNISRSFMFGLGIPFTHTGVRATYKLWKDKITTYWGLNNGWDQNIDNNTFKTWEYGTSVNLTDSINYSNAIYWGPQASQQSGHRRFLMSNVVSWQATEKLAFKSELNFANQNRVVTNSSGLQGPDDPTVGYDNAQWWGLALYTRYALTEKWGASYRLEYFRDKERTRTATTVNTITDPGNDTLWAMTFGNDYQLYENLLGRVEYRFDKANDRQPFSSETSQSTLGAQLIYSFA